MSCFTQGEDVGIMCGSELAYHAPLVGLRDAAPDVEYHGFEVRVRSLSFPQYGVGLGCVNWPFSVFAV
jgi:hypothetical protein